MKMRVFFMADPVSGENVFHKLPKYLVTGAMMPELNIPKTIYNEKLIKRIKMQNNLRWTPLSAYTQLLWVQPSLEHTWPKGYWLKHFNNRYASVQIILEGNMSVTSGEQEYIVNAGTAVVIPPGNCGLATGPSGLCRKLYFIPEGQMFYASIHQLGFDRISLLPNFLSQDFFHTYNRLCTLFEHKEMESIQECSALAFKLISYTANQYRLAHIPPVLSACIEYIHKNIDRSVSLDTLSSAVHISKSALKELFRDHLHTSPGRYITLMRLNYAKTLLEDPTLSIKEAADLCGYENPFYFSSAFHKEFGASPRAYRKNIFTSK